MKWLMSMLLVTACTLPTMFAGHGTAQTQPTAQTQTTQTSSETRSEEHSINGRPVRTAASDMDAPVEPARHKRDSRSVEATTCRHNDDCASKVCFVGRGELGYCTKMCNSFSDCPTFWDCDHVGNAPQRICMQAKD